MIPFEEALELLRGLPAAGEQKRVPLTQAAGRVVAHDVCLDRDQPSFDRSTMDGYALGLEAGRSSYRVVGTLTAGTHFDGTLGPGEALRIMTGAPCPKASGGARKRTEIHQLTNAPLI